MRPLDHPPHTPLTAQESRDFPCKLTHIGISSDTLDADSRREQPRYTLDISNESFDPILDEFDDILRWFFFEGTDEQRMNTGAFLYQRALNFYYQGYPENEIKHDLEAAKLHYMKYFNPGL